MKKHFFIENDQDARAKYY